MVIVDVDVVVVVVVDVAVSLTDAASREATHAAKRTTTPTFIFASIFSLLLVLSLSHCWALYAETVALICVLPFIETCLSERMRVTWASQADSFIFYNTLSL